MTIKKAILTGGGRGTRLHPITTTINKHLLPLANKPMIFHAIEKVVEAGVTHIYINTNPGDTSLRDYIGDGGHWGISIEYFEQHGGPQGIAHVVEQAKHLIGDDPFIFYLSDNILLGSVKEMVADFNTGNYDCMLALSEVPDPERFGVPYFDQSGKLIDVVEKPEAPPNNLAVTGIYIYGPKIFFESFQNITKSNRGEYEISAIHADFLKRGLHVGHKEITGWWKDTGKVPDLLLASKLLLDNMHEREFPTMGQIDEKADISGNVHIGIGSKIGPNVKITGPVIIAENCQIENCEIGPYVSIGAGAVIRDAMIQEPIILDGALIDAPMRIVESMVGKKAQLIKRKEQHLEGHRMVIGDKTVIEM